MNIDFERDPNELYELGYAHGIAGAGPDSNLYENADYRSGYDDGLRAYYGFER